MAEDLQCWPKFSRDFQSIKDPKDHLQFPQDDTIGWLCSIAVSPSGKLFVSSFARNKIHVFSEEREYITSFGSTGKEEEQLDEPQGIAVDSDGLVYVASDSRIDVFREDGTFVLRFGSGQLRGPTHATIYDGLLYIADTSSHRISVYTLQGEHVRCIGEEGSGPGQLLRPHSVAFSPDGFMYVADTENNRVQVFTSDGHYRREFGQGQLDYPFDIAITRNGDVLVADYEHNRVAVFTTQGNLVHSIAVKRPNGVTIDKEGNILATYAAHGHTAVVVF